MLMVLAGAGFFQISSAIYRKEDLEGPYSDEHLTVTTPYREKGTVVGPSMFEDCDLRVKFSSGTTHVKARTISATEPPPRV